jgi:hypothetical protein
MMVSVCLTVIPFPKEGIECAKIVEMPMRRLNYVIKNDGIRVSYRDSVSKGRDRMRVRKPAFEFTN